MLEARRFTDRYYRDQTGWLKVSARGRVFRMTAEQFLNHLLPAIADVDRIRLAVTVELYERPYWQVVVESQSEDSVVD